jgi:hypothetical protein
MVLANICYTLAKSKCFPYAFGNYLYKIQNYYKKFTEISDASDQFIVSVYLIKIIRNITFVS